MSCGPPSGPGIAQARTLRLHGRVGDATQPGTELKKNPGVSGKPWFSTVGKSKQVALVSEEQYGNSLLPIELRAWNSSTAGLSVEFRREALLNFLIVG